jgi:hypothetical protein
MAEGQFNTSETTAAENELIGKGFHEIVDSDALHACTP